MDVFEARYHAKRKAGISARRRDGSMCDPETDRQAGHAELFAASEFGVNVDDSVGADGDVGCDFQLLLQFPKGHRLAGIEVVWNGFEKGSHLPRLRGNLLVNPFEPHRYRNSDIFVSVAGTIDAGFRFLGWATLEDVKAREPRDFGYGRRYWVPTDDLRPIDSLRKLLP